MRHPILPRLAPFSPLPPFAFVPGRHGRPAAGHVVEHTASCRQFAWGLDLFNHGYYWEAHEAWETLWARSRKGSRRHLLLKGLILLAAAGVKSRQSNAHGVARHAARAEAAFLRLAEDSGRGYMLGLSLADLAHQARRVGTLGARRSDPANHAGPVIVTVAGRIAGDSRRASEVALSF